MTGEQQYWENVQEALSRIFDQCEEIDSQSGYDMLEDIQFVRGFINRHKPQTEKCNGSIKAVPCEDAISRSSVFEIMGNLMSIPYDLDRPINKKDVSESMNEIRALPPVIPTRKEGMQDSVLDKIRAEIKEKIEQEEFARSIFRHEEKDTAKAEQCTGSIMAYNNVIKLIDKYKAGNEKCYIPGFQSQDDRRIIIRLTSVHHWSY